MKTKFLFIFFIFCLFSGVILIDLHSKQSPKYKVLDIVRADLFYVDINNNSKIDKNELFKLKDVYSFSPELNGFSIKNSQKLHIDKLDYLKIGYLAQKWANDNLKGSEIVITSIAKDKSKPYSYITAEYKGNDLAVFYLENGLAFTNPSSSSNILIHQNNNQIADNANELSKLNFVLLNLNSKIYHKLNCEFVDLMYNAKLILYNQIKGFIPCKNCNIAIDNSEKTNVINNHGFIANKNFDDFELYFTNPHAHNMPDNKCTTAMCQKLLYEIDNANNSIDIAIYGFGDVKKIYDALLRAKNRGVKIRAIADYSSKMDELYPKTREFIKEFRANTDKNEIIMHNKFFIFDNKKVFTGSANISPSGIGGYSANSAIVINSVKIAKRYEKEFEQMYNSKFSTKKDKIDIASDKSISVYFSPKDDIKKLILSKINSSKSEICISAFYLTSKEIINSLIGAKERNVKVYVILDAAGANNFKDRVGLLRKSGISTIVENWGGKDHEKTIMIDDKTLILGSLNFSNAAFNKNDENIVVIENGEACAFYRKYFFYLYNSIDKKFLKYIPRAEGKDSINSCSDGVDNNFDGKIDFDDDGCK